MARERERERERGGESALWIFRTLNCVERQAGEGAAKISKFLGDRMGKRRGEEIE